MNAISKRLYSHFRKNYKSATIIYRFSFSLFICALRTFGLHIYNSQLSCFLVGQHVMGYILVDEERDHASGHHAYQVRLKTLVESNSSLVSAMRSNRNTGGVSSCRHGSYLLTMSIRFDNRFSKEILHNIIT